MYKHLILLITLFSLCMVSVASGGWEEAKSAFEKGDSVTAFKEFKTLAEQGDPRAQFNLGTMYDNGEGVPQNYAEAVKWYGKAAEQGRPNAQNNLALMYLEGQGVARNYDEAVKWFRKAAEQGYSEAQYNLGAAYANGQSVPQDFVQAHMWFNLAGAQGNSEAQTWRDKVAAKMTPAQIAEAQRLARDWKPKSQ
jgi:uncharacterized protein